MTYVITIRLPNSRRPSLARVRLQKLMTHIDAGFTEQERPRWIVGNTLRGNTALGLQRFTPTKGTGS